jgi:hypothetical protein
VDEEVAHRREPGAVEVDGRAPRLSGGVVEELGRIGMQVVAVGSEVVVDHVEEHHQPERVRGVHQRFRSSGVP